MDWRARIADDVAENPGMNTREVAERTGLNETTVAYHLGRLAKEGRVRSQVIGRARCWYATHCGLCPVLRRLTALLRRPAYARVTAALTTDPLEANELARRADVGLGSARWVTGELQRAHLLQRTQSGRKALHHHAAICIGHAQTKTTCDLWGRCAMSAAWRDARSGERAVER